MMKQFPSAPDGFSINGVETGESDKPLDNDDNVNADWHWDSKEQVFSYIGRSDTVTAMSRRFLILVGLTL